MHKVTMLAAKRALSCSGAELPWEHALFNIYVGCTEGAKASVQNENVS